MRTFKFIWAYPANEVYITGTFDNWTKSIKLERNGNVFEKTIELDDSYEKVLYKFVVDGVWTTDDLARCEKDAEGYVNNVIYMNEPAPAPSSMANSSAAAAVKQPIQAFKSIISSKPPASSGAMSSGEDNSAIPGAFSETTPSPPPASSGAMSSGEDDSAIPGAFPETPANEEQGYPAHMFDVTSTAPNSAQNSLNTESVKQTAQNVYDSAKQATQTAQTKVQDNVNTEPVKQTTQNVSNLAKQAAQTTQTTVQDNLNAESLKQATQNVYDSAKQVTQTAYESTKQTAQETYDTIKQKMPSTEQIYNVAPLPATSGIGNPVNLKPGEKVPDSSTFTTNTVNSTVRTDKKSYENSGGGPPQLGPVVTPEAERLSKGGMFGIPTVGTGLIPESSLPMRSGKPTKTDVGVTIQSAAPQSSSAELAGSVSMEPRGVPRVVLDSQREAHAEPEASASTEAVQEKREVEHELLKEVTTQPPTVEGTGGSQSTTPAYDTQGVPYVVLASQREVHASPEASASAEAVREKHEAEEELLKEVKAQPAATEGATVAASARKAPVYDTPGVPRVVLASQRVADAQPEASASAEAVREKHEVEDELLKEVSTKPSISENNANTPPFHEAAVEERPAHGKTRAINPMVQKAIDSMNSAHGATAHEIPTQKLASAEILTKEASFKETTEAQESLPGVPPVVVESVREAHQSPEVAADRGAVQSKVMVEDEPAPVISAPFIETAPGHNSETLSSFAPNPTTSGSGLKQYEFSDVSPMASVTLNPAARIEDQQKPLVATGPVITATESPAAVSAAGAVTPPKERSPSNAYSNTPESSHTSDSGATDKKSKRRSFFGKLKEKLR